MPRDRQTRWWIGVTGSSAPRPAPSCRRDPGEPHHFGQPRAALVRSRITACRRSRRQSISPNGADGTVWIAAAARATHRALSVISAHVIGDVLVDGASRRARWRTTRSATCRRTTHDFGQLHAARSVYDHPRVGGCWRARSRPIGADVRRRAVAARSGGSRRATKWRATITDALVDGALGRRCGRVLHRSATSRRTHNHFRPASRCWVRSRSPRRRAPAARSRLTAR